MTEDEWEARIGEIFQITRREDCHVRWDIFPRIKLEERTGKLRGLSGWNLGHLLYLGNKTFFSIRVDYKIQIHNKYEEWHTILESVDHV
jgi:hypothetical protein